MRAIIFPSIVLMLFVNAAFASETATPVQWIDQFGSSGAEKGYGMGVDKHGDIYFSYYSSSSGGNNNVFLRKYSSTGNVLWTEPLGKRTYGRSMDIELDDAGDIYVTGSELSGDAFLSKYDSNGSLHWSQQFGSTFRDFGYDVSVDSQGNVFVSGLTEGAVDGVNAGGGDAFLTKFDSNGSELWSRQYGTSGYDFGEGVATDSVGNAYVTGNTNYGYPVTDIDTLVVKYDPNGSHVWTREINPAGYYVGSSDIAIVDDKVYVIGEDIVGGGGWDAFLVELDTAGNQKSYFNWGSNGGDTDLASDIAIDPTGGFIVAGVTRGDIDGANQGSQDAFITKFDATGSFSWSKQIGTPGTDYGNNVAIDQFGNIYLGGDTTGLLGDSSAGNFDAYLIKLSSVPEPGAVILSTTACLLLMVTRRRNIR